MAKYVYPNLEDFFSNGFQPTPCPCNMAKVRESKGKKRKSTPEPACYGKDCGAASRDSLKALHGLNSPQGQDSVGS